MSTEKPAFRVALNGATMGTRYSVLFYSEAEKGHAGLGKALHAAVSDVDAVMSNWKAESDLSRLNRAEPGRWLDLPESLIEVLDAALAIEKASNGAFDIGVGEAVAAWGFGPHPCDAPPFFSTPRAITRDTLELDRANRRVRKHAPLGLDLSGIAKGYGVDRLGAVLLAAGKRDWLVGIDGEMRGKGSKPDGHPWAVGLEHPIRGHREIEGVIELTDLAAATSGTYRHCRDIDGRSLSHTIDPATGEPIDGRLASVTVLAETCMTADAWATAILVDGHWPPRRFMAPAGIEAILTGTH
jgi:FAD:protein FMN transferase